MTPAWVELEMIHDAVLTVRCPRCQAPAGVRCVNPVTQLPAKVPCRLRSKAAGEAAT